MPGDLQAFLENREISKWIVGGGGDTVIVPTSLQGQQEI